MLDDMAENNPENYKTFVEKNVKEGFGDMAEKKKKEVDEQKVKPKEGFLLKFNANLKSEILKE